MIKVLHIISSFSRGGRERQLATILNGSFLDIEHKALVFNKIEDSYIEEYNLSGKIIYINNQSKINKLFSIIAIIRKLQPHIIWSWGGYEATVTIFSMPFQSFRHVNGSIRHGVVLKNKKHLWRKLVLKFSKYVVANSKEGLRVNGILNGIVLYNGLGSSFEKKNAIEPFWKEIAIYKDISELKIFYVANF